MSVGAAARRREAQSGMGWRGCIPDPPVRQDLISPLPATSCFLCGHRGWCGHRKPW